MCAIIYQNVKGYAPMCLLSVSSLLIFPQTNKDMVAFLLLVYIQTLFYYRKPCLKRSLKKTPKLVSNTNYRLIQVKSIAECSPRSILQYFRPSLSYHLFLRPLFYPFIKWPLKTVLLYLQGWMVALAGTAFPDIRLIVKKDLETASWLFTGGSLGYMIGAFVGGLVFDR